LEIAPVLAHIFQKSLDSGQAPSDWRVANISPIFKKGDRCTPSNYRPVSITSVCSKLLEHIIFSNIMEHYNQHNILTDAQHGFRRGRSCETQLIMTAQDLTKSIDDGKQTDAIVLDFLRHLTESHTKGYSGNYTIMELEDLSSNGPAIS
jgi:hypothetical protein